ncbi:unnamed protein product [Timema podura]|uniref:Uncharacterized protein n=1 Tax=Timema podura TaxID=61482 RepID=A0ABN7PCK7_TIMPD|nr:unnamed protein product [Timema podura]
MWVDSGHGLLVSKLPAAHLICIEHHSKDTAMMSQRSLIIGVCFPDKWMLNPDTAVGEGAVPGEEGLRHWVRRTNLVDSRTSVTDVKFGPKSMGLLVATCSADGIVRIYEAPDIMNLAQWTLQHEMTLKLSCSCLSWNPSFNR